MKKYKLYKIINIFGIFLWNKLIKHFRKLMQKESPKNSNYSASYGFFKSNKINNKIQIFEIEKWRQEHARFVLQPRFAFCFESPQIRTIFDEIKLKLERNQLTSKMGWFNFIYFKCVKIFFAKS